MNTVPLIDFSQAWRTKHLTPAEQCVVELIVTGLTTKQVAARLGQSPFTVGNQLQSAMRKLGVTPRFGLMAKVRVVAVTMLEKDRVGEAEKPSLEYAI